ncbi:hypothetical protein RhiJN_26739 [Ceratobasidium sp. AG-Ba]|nr:hypothetical protein RhiJN_12690 [Ceratobasidium sp. AG-Ba]QRV98720.1 hypothetical protein RhiJN_26739 [Ceratobasidium sp. AG-Ba]
MSSISNEGSDNVNMQYSSADEEDHSPIESFNTSRANSPSSTIQSGAHQVEENPDDAIPIEQEVPRRKSVYRCAPCSVRGSRCDRFMPSCGRCVALDTTDRCFEADIQAGVLLNVPQEDQQGHGPPNPPSATPSVIPEPPASPSVSPEHTPAPSPAPSRDPSPAPSNMSSDEPMNDHTARPAFRRPTGRILVPGSSTLHPSASRTNTARSRSPPRLGGAHNRNGRARSPAPLRRNGTQRSTNMLTARNRATNELRDALEKMEAARTALDILDRINQESITTPGLNVGVLRTQKQSRGPIAEGVIAEANFTFVAPGLANMFLKKNWVNYISMVYCTDAHNKQSNLHLTSTTYRSKVNPITGETTYVAQPLPDLDEHKMSFVDHCRAYQRFEAILKSIGNPNTERWRRHGEIIRSHPLITVNWELILAYDIAIRRRAVYDDSLDMGIFQPNIFEECRHAQQEERFAELSRAASARINQNWPESRTPHTRHQIASPQPGPSQPSQGAPANGNSLRVDKRCFLCGTEGHVPKRCTKTPILVNISDNGKWLLNADAWEAALLSAKVLNNFSDLPSGIRNGFRIGVSSSLSSTTIHPNHKSALDHPDAVLKHIAKEVDLGRYSGPYSPSELFNLIGHFRASPLGVVDKASSPGDFRIVQDFSYPRNSSIPSVNSEINPQDFLCTWGFFSDVVNILLSLPEGSQAATFDVDAAYRRMPVHPDDQPHIVVHWDGECWIDHCVPFGGTSSGGIFGRCGDALIHICENKGFGPVLKWVDDFLFFRSPVPGHFPHAFAYSEQDIYELAAALGVPWKVAKTKPFSEWFQYLGFDWDIPARAVSIPPEKRQKFATKIKNWLSLKKVSLKSTQSILGSLIHCTLVVNEGRSRISGIARLTAAFSHHHRDRFITKTPTTRAIEDAKWWLNQLEHGECRTLIRPPPPRSQIECFMDASTSFGVGIVINNKYASWRLNKGWKAAGRDIGWAEIVAVELAVGAIIGMGVRDVTVTLHSDNQGVIGAIRAGRSRNDQQNLVLQRIHTEAMAHGLCIDMQYVATKANKADAPSRGESPKEYQPITSGITVNQSLDRWIERSNTPRN